MIESFVDLQEFYDSAWDKLVITASILFTVLSLAIFVLLYLTNYRYFKLKIEKKFNTMKFETIADIKAEYKEDMKIVRQEYYNKARGMRGMSADIEGKTLLFSGKTDMATECFFEAIRGYLHAKDYKNFKLMVNLIIDKCLPELSKLELVNIFKRMNTTQDDYFHELRKIDRSEYGRGEIIELLLKCDLIEVNELFLK